MTARDSKRYPASPQPYVEAPGRPLGYQPRAMEAPARAHRDDWSEREPGDRCARTVGRGTAGRRGVGSGQTFSRGCRGPLRARYGPSGSSATCAPATWLPVFKSADAVLRLAWAFHPGPAAFVSQSYPLSPDPSDQVVLPPQVLAHFTRPYETVLV